MNSHGTHSHTMKCRLTNSRGVLPSLKVFALPFQLNQMEEKFLSESFITIKVGASKPDGVEKWIFSAEKKKKEEQSKQTPEGKCS